MKVFIKGEVPQELGQKFMQYVRDFDTANPGCHFEVLADVPDLPLNEVIKMLQVKPSLTFEQIFELNK